MCCGSTGGRAASPQHTWSYQEGTGPSSVCAKPSAPAGGHGCISWSAEKTLIVKNRKTKERRKCSVQIVKNSVVPLPMDSFSCIPRPKAQHLSTKFFCMKIIMLSPSIHPDLLRRHAFQTTLINWHISTIPSSVP